MESEIVDATGLFLKGNDIYSPHSTSIVNTPYGTAAPLTRNLVQH